MPWSTVPCRAQPHTSPAPHLVDVSQLQPRLAPLVLAEVDLPHARLDLRPPQPRVVPAQGGDQLARQGAGGGQRLRGSRVSAGPAGARGPAMSPTSHQPSGDTVPLPRGRVWLRDGTPREVFAVFGGVPAPGRWEPQPGHLRCCCPGRVFSGSLRWRARVPCSPPAPPGWGTAWAVLWGTARDGFSGGGPQFTATPHTHPGAPQDQEPATGTRDMERAPLG